MPRTGKNDSAEGHLELQGDEGLSSTLSDTSNGNKAVHYSRRQYGAGKWWYQVSCHDTMSRCAYGF